MISHRHRRANNPLVESYDVANPTNHLIYWDANNLYGWAMSQPLPYDSLRWLDDDEVERLDVVNVPVDADEGTSLRSTCTILPNSTISTQTSLLHLVSYCTDSLCGFLTCNMNGMIKSYTK